MGTDWAGGTDGTYAPDDRIRAAEGRRQAKGMTHKESRERDAQIVDAYLSGATEVEISEQYGMPITRVPYILVKGGAKTNIPRTGRRFPEGYRKCDYSETRDAYLRGDGIAQIASSVGISESGIRRRLSVSGTPLRRIDQIYRRIPREDLIEMRLGGATVLATANAFGISKQRVSQLMKRHNLETQDQN